ncbi:MAG: amidohydrolase [Halieaceae bacterium]
MFTRSSINLIAIGSLAIGLAACQESPKPAATPAAPPPVDAADMVLTNGRIYTVNPEQPWAQAVAISDGRYRYIGNAEGVDSLIGESTRVIDLAGKMAMPGINDGHSHPMQGAMKDLFECNFPFTATPDDIAKAISTCVAEQPDDTWIRGGQWGSDFFIDNDIPNPKEWLDAVSGDKAVYLADDALHNAWFNSKALEILGVTADTPNPPGVEILHDENGEPTGVVLEVFGWLQSSLEDWPRAGYLQGAQYVVSAVNGYGITGMKGASASNSHITGFIDLDKQGDMTVHYAGSLQTPYGHREEPLDVAELEARRDRLKSANVDTRFVKLFMDGVPTASRTAAMLAPYTAAEAGAELTDGALHISETVLTQDMIALDRAGFTVKIHTAGDRSVRVALNAIEAARKANGNSELRHELAHAGYISNEDLPRFAELNAVADLSPYIWNPSPIIQSVISAVGSPRGEQYWPVKSLIESGAPLLAGSDWPAAAANMSPWASMEALVTRSDPIGDYPGVLWTEEAISLEQAVDIFTRQGARALRLGDETGSVEVGKLADLIVLNQNLFEVPVTAVSDTQVERVIFKGEVVLGD